MSYAIVIDACIARAAGESDPDARRCRETLDGVANHGHKMAMSKPLQDEWLKSRSQHLEPYSQYASMYAFTWFVKMRSEKRIIWVELEQASELRERILEVVDDQDREQVDKDCYLVETAWASDRRVLSEDRRIHGHFSRLGQTVKELCEILWLNPRQDHVLDWLREGAPDRREYRLCDALL